MHIHTTLHTSIDQYYDNHDIPKYPFDLIWEIFLMITDNHLNVTDSIFGIGLVNLFNQLLGNEVK